MKKFIVGALCAMLGFAAFASGEAYHVYKLAFTAKTTDAKGVTTAPCGDGDYCYREKQTVKIKGVLAGCGCQAIKANGVCDAAILYLWDETRKIQITNVTEVIPWRVQRVGKKATVVEHFASFRATYGEDDRYSFEIVLSGFGTYKEYSKDKSLSYVSSISGNFAGAATAPIYVKAGKCSVCSIEPDEVFETTAWNVCEGCGEGCCGIGSDELSESDDRIYTPFYGTYTVSYDTSKSKNISKNGPSAKGYGLPSYVNVLLPVATNIGMDL